MRVIYPTFKEAIRAAYADFNHAPLVHPAHWQGVDVSNKPEAQTYELFNYDFHVSIPTEDLFQLRRDINPNLPWADNHFNERVCGLPINPGEQWKHWPWGNSADKFRDKNGQFNHNYMERYWPKHAGLNEWERENLVGEDIPTIFGIRHPYGDLNDIVNQLASDPTTRQAYLPVFFPEDTGAVHQGRVPCSLGYHFIQRRGFLHINYYLRSCEAHRHFKDDIYLTVRLLLWVLDKLRDKDDQWYNVQPGIFSMYITSFHCFINDRPHLEA